MLLRFLGVEEDAEGVDGDGVDEDVDLYEGFGGVVGEGVVHAGVALGAGFELVVEVDEHFGEGELVLEEDAALAGFDVAVFEVVHLVEGAAAAGDEVHDGADEAVGGDDGDVHPGLADLGDAAGVGELGRGVDGEFRAVGEADAVLDGGGGGEELDVVLAFEALLDDVHVEEAEEAGAEAGAEGDGGFGLVVEGGVVELEFLEGVAEELVVFGVGGVEAGEDHALGRFVAVEGGGRGCGVVGDGVSDVAVADGLEAGGDVADLAGLQRRLRREGGAKDADLQGFEDASVGHEAQLLAPAEAAVGDADVGDDAFVRVVLRVEDEGAQGGGGVATGRGHTLDDGVEERLAAGALLGGDEEDLVAGEADDLGDLLGDAVRLGGVEVDLVDDGDDGEVLVEGEVDVGEGLGLDALGSINDEEGAFAGGEGAGDFVGEVDVAGGVDEVELVGAGGERSQWFRSSYESLRTNGGRPEGVRGPSHADGGGFDGDAALAFEVHGVEDLFGHLARGNGAGELEEAVGEGGFAVVDVGDDAEVADPPEVGHGAGLGGHGLGLVVHDW